MADAGLLAMARRYHAAADYARVEQSCRQVLADDPHQAEAWRLLAEACLLQGRSGEAAEAHHNLGVALARLGRPDEAVQSYREAVRLRPGYAEAHSKLGIALEARGELDEAVASYQRALQLDPNYGEARDALAVALERHGRLGEAQASSRRAREVRPDSAEAHSNLGIALHRQGKLDEAMASYRRALELRPDYAEAHINLGVALAARGRLDEATASYLRALELRPDSADAHINLGVALAARSKVDEAMASYRRALELRPDSADAHSNLGIALHRQGKLDEAMASYRRALELRPNSADVHINLGVALAARGKLDEAMASYRRTLELRPNYAEAHSYLGHALQKKGRLDEAVASYRRALELRPDYADAYINLGTALKNQGQTAEAITCYQHALDLKPDHHVAHSNLLYLLPFCLDYDARTLHEEHLRWNRQHAEPLAKCFEHHPNDRSADRRLRVGYVSPDFCNHVQSFFTVPLLSSHDHRNFEIFCYADVARPDSITARLRGHVDVWKDIAGLADEQVAQLVRQDRIDILVDLTMHMGGNHLLVFARKPAPVQVCWLAYPGTTGLSAIDYRLTDPYLDPPGLDDRWYSEASVRLPDCFWCYDPLTDEPGVSTLPALGKGYITFGSLNNFCKVNDGCLALWARASRAVPGSRLLLMAPEGPARDRVRARLHRDGIAASRVVFVDKRPRPEYLALYHQIDLCLDPLPYNGHTTSLDAFWMGVPTLTMPGRTAVGRGGVCLLKTLGLTELIAEDPEGFARIAAELADDLPRLSELRATLRHRLENSPLMDAPRFARNVEAAYRLMWQRWCAK